jgi:hypothetical protein
MKTWELVDTFGVDHLHLVDRAEPTPGIGQVLVK